MGRKGFEPLASRLSVGCSSQAELPAHSSLRLGIGYNSFPTRKRIRRKDRLASIVGR